MVIDMKTKNLNEEQLRAEVINKEFLIESTIDRAAINENEMLVTMSVSSDVPYLRWFGYETLDHSATSIRLDRFLNGAAFRDTHYGDQIGIIQNPRIDEKTKKLLIDVKFSKNSERALTIFNDIKDGIRKNVSIRYIVHEMILEKKVDDVDYYRVTDWEPIHASMEADPADYSVGVGRSRENKETPEKEIDELKNKVADLENNIKEITITNKRGAHQMKKEETELTAEQQEAVNKALAEGKKAEAERVAGIFTLAENFKAQLPDSIDVSKEIESFIKDGSKSVNDALNHLIGLKNSPEALKQREIGLSNKEIQQFSYSKLLLVNDTQSKVDASFEVEACRAAAQKIEIEGVGSKGFILPQEILKRQIDFSKGKDRALLVSAATAAGGLVGTEYRPQDFIELARNKMLAPKLGVRRLEGLTQNLSLPVQTGAGTFSWQETEGTGVSESNLTVTTKSMTPKTGSSWTSYSRKLLAQAMPQIDSLIEDDLTTIAALGEDYAVFNGTGLLGQPTGIINTSNIGTVDGTGFNKAKAVEFQTDIQVANLDVASMYYVVNPVVAGTLKTTAQVANYPKYLLENGQMEGFPVMASNQFPNAKMLFGDFSQCIVGHWGYELIPDPFTLSTDGKIRVTLFVYVDVLVRQPAAFSYASSVTFA